MTRSTELARSLDGVDAADSLLVGRGGGGMSVASFETQG